MNDRGLTPKNEAVYKPGEMDNGYGADLLYALTFDPSGKWKVVKTHRMSEKEVKEHQ